MMTPNTSSSSTRGSLYAMPPILLGIALFVIGRPLDGFVGGLFTGAAIALEVLGAYLIGQAMFGDHDTDDHRGWWLPSRDAGDSSDHRSTSGGDDR